MFKDAAAGRRYDAVGAIEILDAARQPLERAALPFRQAFVGRLRHVECAVGRLSYIGIEDAGLFHRAQMRARELGRGEGFGSKAVARRGERQMRQIGHDYSMTFGTT